ncbi:MAG: ribonuclease HII [Acidimicrobiia bacterium]
MSLTIYPGNEIEQKLIVAGKTVCAMDEVGRGAWAGPLVIACVIPGAGTIEGVRDSKKISIKKREQLSEKIWAWAKTIGIGATSNEEIDKYGLGRCLTIAAIRALENIDKLFKPDYVLLDGSHNFIKNNSYEVQTIVKGDNISHAIAAASIVAKVYRDNIMSSTECIDKYGVYGFEKNKGYPSPAHRQALSQYGPCDMHRVSWNIFEPIDESMIADALV